MSPYLSCRSISVDHGDLRAIDTLSLDVEDGETVAVLGPSGSGKSTLMYSIAGFIDLSEGTIEIGGETVSKPGESCAPEKRPVGLVFQSYALWPHLTAEETVAYPLRRAGMGRSASLKTAGRLLQILEIAHLAERKPAELSGGQQQRVGLARALAREAGLYLFDEPTAHLDASVREAVQAEIARRRAETGAAAIYSTHDSAEALALADRVAILRHGSVVQVGPPQVVYERPIDVWAARLTGPASVLEVTAVRSGEGKMEVAVGGTTVVAEADDAAAGPQVPLLVRPEWVEMEGPVPGKVLETWFRGSHTDYRLATPAGTLEARIPGPPRLGQGESAGWTLRRGWVPGP